MSETKITMSADVQTMINLFYPVGIIIEFSNDTNPNNLYPWQTWKQDTSGRVLISSSASHALGSMGGEETHVLTVSEMPGHTHSFNPSGSIGSAGAHTHTYSGTTSNSGAHTHPVTAHYDLNAVKKISRGDRPLFAQNGGTSGTSSAFETASAGAHTHTYSGTTSNSGGHNHTFIGTAGTTGTSGSGNAHNNMQPYETVARWIRTA